MPIERSFRGFFFWGCRLGSCLLVVLLGLFLVPAFFSSGVADKLHPVLGMPLFLCLLVVSVGLVAGGIYLVVRRIKGLIAK